MLLGDRLAVPWYRTIFTNVGDVIAPETLPPLELESRPVEVGELISDQLSHLWFSSLLRHLADAAVPEKLPPLQLTSEPDDTILPSKIMLFPRWSSVIETVRAFAPDETKPAQAAAPRRAEPPPAPTPSDSLAAELEYLRFMENDLRTDLRRSGLRVRIWIALAAAQALFVVASLFWIK